MSAKSPVERIANGIAGWLNDNFNTYLARANADQTYVAPELKKCEVKAWIPTEGPFPYMMVNLDFVDYEWIGNCAEKAKLTLSVNALVTEPKKDNLPIALVRYMDALADAVRENITMNGTADTIRVDTIDKGEMPADGRGWVVATLIATAEVAG